MNKIILSISILIIVIIYCYNKDTFSNVSPFRPFYVNRINQVNDRINNYPYWYPTFFKLGEVNVDNGINRNYDTYLKNLHNEHLSKKISNNNTECKSC